MEKFLQIISTICLFLLAVLGTVTDCSDRRLLTYSVVYNTHYWAQQCLLIWNPIIFGSHGIFLDLLGSKDRTWIYNVGFFPIDSMNCQQIYSNILANYCYWECLIGMKNTLKKRNLLKRRVWMLVIVLLPRVQWLWCVAWMDPPSLMWLSSLPSI